MSDRLRAKRVIGIERNPHRGADAVGATPDAGSTAGRRDGRTAVVQFGRLTRLTNGHLKRIENHVHAMSLWFMYYNFCRPHMTLIKANGGIKQTPAMAAGAADCV